jgi:hypothetical protein
MADIVTRSNSSVNCGSGKKILSRAIYSLQIRNPLKHRGSMHTAYCNIQILPTQCICVFHVVLTINNDLSLNNIYRLNFLAET